MTDLTTLRTENTLLREIIQISDAAIHAMKELQQKPECVERSVNVAMALSIYDEYRKRWG